MLILVQRVHLLVQSGGGGVHVEPQQNLSGRHCQIKDHKDNTPLFDSRLGYVLDHMPRQT